MRLKPVFAAALLAAAALRVRGEEPDDLQLRLLEPYPLSVRWDNVEGPPRWVSGPEPRHSARRGLDIVTLPPGATVSLRLPPRGLLRVLPPQGTLEVDDLEFWMSDGSGAYVEGIPYRPAGSRSLVVAAPDRPGPVLARVTRPARRDGAVDVALFVSRPETLKPIAPYRGLQDLPPPRERVRREDEELTSTCVRVAPGSPLAVKVSGPVRLLFEARLRYPADEIRTYQPFRVFVRLDGAAFRTLEFETTADTSFPVRVDDVPRIMGRRETAPLEIPAGEHALELDPTADLSVRLLRLFDPDYFWPGLNAPRPDAHALRNGGLPAAPAGTTWDITEEEARRIAGDGPGAAAEKRRLALRLARDNGRPDGGLLGAMLLDAAAAGRPEAPSLRDLADEALGFHTTWRDLVPIEPRPGPPHARAWFFRSRLLDVGEAPHELVLADPHMDGLLAGVPDARFFPIGDGADAAVRCRVPARAGPSRLRVAVENGSLPGPAAVEVQLDRQPPVRLLIVPGPELPADAHRPTLEEAALAVLEWKDRGAALIAAKEPEKDAPPQAAAPVAGDVPAFLPAAHGLPDARVQAGVVELPLSPDVREVRIWSVPPADGAAAGAPPRAPRRVALQYRASKPHRMAESEYLETIRRAGDGWGIADALLGREAPPGADPLAARELNNDWLPLLRRMRAQHNAFVAAVAPPRPAPAPAEPAPGGAPPKADDDAAAALAAQARTLEQAGDWTGAVEIWGRLVYTARGDARRQALFGRINALQELGQEFIADKLLRGLLIHDADEGVRREALLRLARLRLREGDTEALCLLFAAAAVRSPAPATLLRSYADACRANNDPEAALTVGLELPRPEQPVPTLLEAAYQMGWWRTYDDLAARLPSAEERAYWAGLRLCAQGDPAKALVRLREGGEKGRAMADALEQALSIRADLASADPAVRLRAIPAWERWQDGAPGPRRWREDESVVADCAATAVVQRIDGDGVPRVYYEPGPGRPLRLRVAGPVRLRLEVRLLLPPGTTLPTDDWLRVREAGRLREFPILGIAPSPELTLLGDAARVPSQRFVAEQQIGPGLHELEVSSGASPVAVRPYLSRPEIVLGVLPPLSPSALQAACRMPPAGEMPERPARESYPAGAQVLPAGGGTPVRMPVSRWPADDDAAPAVDGGVPAVRALAERAGGAASETSRDVLARWGTAPSARPVPAADAPGLPVPEREAALWEKGDFEAAVALPLDRNDDDAVLRRMALLLRLAGAKPERRPRVLAVADALFSAHARVPGLSAVHARIIQDSVWSPVTSIQSSAGLRTVEVKGWAPESPGLRMRRALMAPLAPGDQVLYGTDKFGVSFQNLRPTELTLDLTLEDVDALTPVPLTAVYQVDQGAEEKVTLTPENPVRSVRIPLPEGTHGVRARLDGALLHQALRVGMHEKRPEAGSPPAGVPDDALVKTVQRSYAVATAREPLRVTLEGPAWLRIDERRGDRTETRYRLLADGWQDVELKPAEGQAEALFRLFVRTPAQAPPAPPLRPVEVPREPLPPPMIPAPRAEAVDPLTLGDPFPLGGQEDGTWAFSLRREKRRLVEDERRKVAGADWFEELSATYRYYDDEGTWTQTEVLGRLHDETGPTFGLLESVLHRPPETLTNLRLDLAAYAQQPDSPLPGQDAAWEWSLGARGAVEQIFELSPTVHHTASLAVFGRALSMDQLVSSYAAGRVDHDVFTRYKSEHRYGVRLAEQLTAQPWLDTEWTARVWLTSNEGVVVQAPDHAGGGVGWSQLLGPARADLRYEAILYFNDDDRSRAFLRNTFLADVVWWDVRVSNRSRLEFGVDVRRDSAPGDMSGFVFVTWFFDGGRGYRDFMPGSVDFSELRRRRWLRETGPFAPGTDR